MNKRIIAALICLLVIPIIFVSYLYYRSVATNLEQNIKNSILLESSYKSKEISQYIQVRQKSLNQLGKLKIFSVAVEYQRFEGINNFFNSLLKSDTEYKGLLFVDRNKTLKAYNFYDNDGKYINNATTYWNSILQKIVYITDDTGIVKINENNSCIVVVAKVKDEFDETKGYLISIYNNQPIKDYLIDAVNKFKKTQNYDLNYITGFVLNNKFETIVSSSNTQSISNITSSKIREQFAEGNYYYFCQEHTLADSIKVRSCFQVPEKQLYAEISKTRVVFPLVISLSVIFLIFISLRLVKLSLKSTLLILGKLKELSQGNYSKLNFKGNAETQKYIENANSLIDKIIEFQQKLGESQKLAAIGRTTSLLAHDVRKPFSQLKIVLNMFDTFKTSPVVLNRAKADIERSIANVESMLNDIMDFSREVRLETKPCFLNAVFDYSIRQTAQIYPHTDVNFSYDVCHTYKPFADDERFARVCTNVILNAIEAVTIMDKKVKGSIYISSKDLIKNDKRFVEIIIANNGPKFRQEDLVNLFTPFFTKGKKEGTGLGLASAYKIVNLHEGTITARNMDVNKAMELGWDRDEGVEFIIDIPASDEHDKIKTDILPKNIKEVALVESKRDRDKIDTIIDKLYQKQKQFKVLLLEDEALYRASVKNTVRKNENLTKMLVLYDVSTVEEALELIKQEDITHAIVDIDLGQARNGFDFIKEIKDKHPQILCMVHSNRHLEKDRIRAKKLGVKAYVPKPLSIEHLVLFLSE